MIYIDAHTHTHNTTHNAHTVKNGEERDLTQKIIKKSQSEKSGIALHEFGEDGIIYSVH